MIACAINERMQRKLDYAQEEIPVLKEMLRGVTGGRRLSFTADQRRRLALAGKDLSPDERRKYCQLVSSPRPSWLGFANWAPESTIARRRAGLADRGKLGILGSS